MHILFERARYSVAVLTVLAIFVTATPEVFAQSGQPGESSNFTPEQISGRPLQTDSSYSEARNGGNLARVWRGQSDNQVWISLGDANFTIANTQTFTAPTVVPYGASGFMVLHVGNDQHIYYVILSPPAGGGVFNVPQSWIQVPGQTAAGSVTAAQYADNGYIYMMYEGTSNPGIYGTWYAPDSGWHLEGTITNGQTLSSPSITYNAYSDELVAVSRGLNNDIYINNQVIGNPTWGQWTSIGQATGHSPEITAFGTQGELMISYVDYSGAVRYSRYSSSYNQIAPGWTEDTTGFHTINPVMLSAFRSAVFALLIGLDRIGYWKQVTN